MNASEVEALLETDDRVRFWEEVQTLPSEYDRLRLVHKAAMQRAHLKHRAAYVYLAKLEPRLRELAELAEPGVPLDLKKLRKEGKVT